MRTLNKKYWPVFIRVEKSDSDVISEMASWLENNFGSFRNNWNAVSYRAYTDFYFKSAKDASFFALRWK